MQKRVSTILFLIGLIAILVMILNFNVSFIELWGYIRRAGYWFLATVALWGGLYGLNALTLRVIIRGSGPCPLSFGRMWQIVVSGFALNTTIPLGGIGGEPYRIIELSKYIGVERATSAVVLFAMTHVFSHFWFWLTGIVIWLIMATIGLLPLPTEMCFLMILASLISVGGIWIFTKGYKYGVACKAIRILGRIPGMKNWSRRFEDKHLEKLQNIDRQIAELRGQNRRSFRQSFFLEYFGRVLQSLEVFFILILFGYDSGPSAASYPYLFVTAFLILVFTSLFANLIGFIPLQLGGREGGFTLSVAALGMTAELGLFIGIICRVREIVWAVIGLLIIKIFTGRNSYANNHHIKTIILLALTLLHLPIQAQQLSGIVVDAESGEGIPMASVIYKGHHIAKVADMEGRFAISKHTGWNLTFSAVGYKERIIPVKEHMKSPMKVELRPDNQQLAGVTVKSKKGRYSRKDNPAVELMRRVIAAKRQTDLKRHDFYQYTRYEKLTLAANDLTPEQLEKKPFANKRWLLDQVERCKYNGKMILPVSVDETLAQHVYRKDPHAEKTIITGQQSTGINDLFQTGDILNVALKDVFTDVNLYDDQIRLLQYPFTSPIGKDAIGFYRFYIEDTLKIERDSVIHLHFLPNNQQDFGFRGDIYILKDSSYHVRRCELTIPKRSDVNFVENLRVEQDFEQLQNGEWVLTRDDMITEMKFAKFLQKAIVIRTTRLSDYNFAELPKELFKGKRREEKDVYAEMRGDDFWKEYRQVELTKSESSMDKFLEQIQQIKGFKYFIFGLKALIENSIETGNPNKIDLTPVNTIFSHNELDNYRSRLSFATTANLNKHWFLNGYYAHGWGSHKNYYNAEITYSLNAKEYLPWEYPKRTFYMGSSYDVCSPSDKFLPTDKDNFLLAWKWTGIDKMILYNRQRIGFEYEMYGGLKTSLELKAEEYEACGKMSFRTLDCTKADYQGMDTHHEFLRTTEMKAELRYAPGETYINNKQRRTTINRDAPVFTLSHTWGMKNVLGADYSSHLTEGKVYKRFWLNSWGKVDVRLKGGVQWCQVPYLLLCMPMANQSFVIEDEMFNLINNMEFLNDRYASLLLSWDMNGKLFNRIPLVRHAKCREFLAINLLWGSLSDKNNPFLPQNVGSSRLMYFPEGSHAMDAHTPYAEVVIGIHNIFKILQVEYVRRLTYLNLPTSEKWGLRYTFRMTF